MPLPKHLTDFGPSRGPAQGAGWGGPARGASASRITPGDPDGIQAMSNDPDVKARQAKRAAKLHDVIYGLAVGEDDAGVKLKDIRHETRLAAAVAFLDRVEGKPLQRQDVTSKGEQIGYVIAAPAEDEDATAWEARQQPE